MNDIYSIFVINPGSTSTKIALFENEHEVFSENIQITSDALQPFKTVFSQKTMRQHSIQEFIDRNGIVISKLHAVVGRGGLLKPVSGGTFRVNQAMLKDLEGAYGEHASNLGAILADALASEAGCPAFIVDPVVVDELEPEARYSGIPEISRKSIFHALNQKSVVRKACIRTNRDYAKSRWIVAHLGGGISVGAHKNGRVVDVNNALDGDGPFSPERAGGLPAGDLITLCFSGDFEERTLRKRLVGQGGLKAYLGTHDLKTIEQQIDNEESDAAAVLKAMVYQICKEIGGMAAVLKGRVDGIVVTGGLAQSERLTTAIRERIDWIAPVLIFPGEAEMEALAMGALRVLKGEESPCEYTDTDSG